MGRPVKALAMLHAVRLAARNADPTQDPHVVHLTRRFLELRRVEAERGVHATVEMGNILRSLRGSLKGQFQRYVRERCHVGTTTASWYVGTAALAEKAPTVVREFAHLGIRRLCRLKDLSAAARITVLDGCRGCVTEAQFSALLALFVRRPRRSPADEKGRRLRRRVRILADHLRSEHLPRPRTTSLRRALKGELHELGRLAGRLSRSL